MSVVVDSRPQKTFSWGTSYFQGMANKTLFELSVSGSEPSNDNYRVQIGIYNEAGSTLLAGPFDYYPDGSNNISANVSGILKGLIDITAGEQQFNYLVKYQEVWTGGSGTLKTIPATFKAIFGYDDDFYDGYVTEAATPGNSFMNKIYRLWAGFVHKINLIAGTNGGDNVIITEQSLDSEGNVYDQITTAYYDDDEILTHSITPSSNVDTLLNTEFTTDLTNWTNTGNSNEITWVQNSGKARATVTDLGSLSNEEFATDLSNWTGEDVAGQTNWFWDSAESGCATVSIAAYVPGLSDYLMQTISLASGDRIKVQIDTNNDISSTTITVRLIGKRVSDGLKEVITSENFASGSSHSTTFDVTLTKAYSDIGLQIYLPSTSGSFMRCLSFELLSHTQSESKNLEQTFAISNGDSVNIKTSLIASNSNTADLHVQARRVSDSGWETITTFSNNFPTNSVEVISIVVATKAYDKIRFFVDNINTDASSTYDIDYFRVRTGLGIGVEDKTTTIKVTATIDSVEVINESFDFFPDVCYTPIMLRWINSIGGLDQYVFDAPYEKSYVFDRNGNKYLNNLLFATGLSQTEWEAMNDILKEGEVYEDQNGIRYRVNHMVWQVDEDGTETPVIVNVESNTTKSHRIGNQFIVEIEYPKETIT